MLQSWLNQVCKVLPGVVEAIVVTPLQGQEEGVVAASWPQQATASEQLRGIATVAARSDEPVVSVAKSGLLVGRALGSSKPGAAVLAGAAVALRLDVPAASRDTLLQLLDWSLDWLALLVQQSGEASGSGLAGNSVQAAEVLSDWLQQTIDGPPQGSLAHDICLRLVQLLGCQRVSIGLLKGGEIKLTGTSASRQFDPHSDFAGLLEGVMNDAAASGLPRQRANGDGQPKDAHFRLCASVGGGRVYSVPLLEASARNSDGYQAAAGAVGAGGALNAGGSNTVAVANTAEGSHNAEGSNTAEGSNPNPLAWAVVVCETGAEQAFDEHFLRQAASWIPALVPLLRLQPRRQRSLWQHCRQRLGQFFNGPEARKNRVALGVGLLVLVTLLFGQATYRVNADAVLEGKVQRAVVAPFDSYIATALVRAGEEVEEGALLAELDDRELLLELDKLGSQRNEYEKQYRQALAQLDRAESRIVQAQIAQVDANIQLLQQQRGRAQLRAPLAGVVIKGDLHHSLGAPVEKGQVLFELAPLDEYRLTLEIDERDIAAVKVGQQGSLVLAALPRQKIPFVVENIAAVLGGETGETVYRTEARLDFPVASLRPGMQGVGKVEVGQRSIIWIAFHDLLDWWRIRVWLWMP